MVSVLITAGPTREYLDDVRYLTNASSGRMGYALAEAAQEAGHRVCLVTGPVQLDPPPGVEVVPVISAREMHAAVLERLAAADLVFGVAAVADYRPAERRVGKPPKEAGPVRLILEPTADIVGSVGERKGDRVVVGFALEAGENATERGIERGRDKLRRKHLDLIAVNYTSAIGAEDNEVVLLFPDGRQERLPRQGKAELARRLLAIAVELWEAGTKARSEGGGG